MTVSMLRKATAPFRESKLPNITVSPVDGEDATIVVPSLSHLAATRSGSSTGGRIYPTRVRAEECQLNGLLQRVSHCSAGGKPTLVVSSGVVLGTKAGSQPQRESEGARGEGGRREAAFPKSRERAKGDRNGA